MIINGGGRCNGGFFAKHLSNPDKNEAVKVIGFRNLAAEDIAGAFREMRAVASGTRCKDYFYHANINIMAHESLTPDQWEKAVDTLEKKLGLTDHARFVVQHTKNGRTHQHIVWSRIDIDRMRAVNMGKDYFSHQAVSRQLEKEFDLERGISVLGKGKEETRPERRPENWEVFRGQESGIDPLQLKKELTAIWKNTNNGKEFVTEIEKRGCVLAKGDKRDFVIIDPVGDVHSLARRLSNVKAADVTTRFADIDMNTLPNVREAKEYQLGRNPQQGGLGMAEEKTDAELEAERIFEDIKEEQDRITQANKDEEDRKADDIKEQEKQKEEQKKEAEKQEQQKAADQEKEKQFKAQADRQAEQAKEMEEFVERLDAFKAEQAKQTHEARRQAAEREGRGASAGDITNPHYRYSQALRNNYDIRQPYSSLARSAMAEYGAFMQERQNLDRQIAKTNDPKERQLLELRKQIEAAEYMEITSQRIAVQSEVITGEGNSVEAVKQRRQAEDFHKEATRLRMEYKEIMEGRTQSGDKAGDRKPAEKPVQPDQKIKPEKPAEVKEQEQNNEVPKEKQRTVSNTEKQLKESVLKASREANNGKEFADAIKKKGYTLAEDVKGEFDFSVKQDGGARLAVIAHNKYVYRLDPERMHVSADNFQQLAKEIKSSQALPSLDDLRAAREQKATVVKGQAPHVGWDYKGANEEILQKKDKPIMVQERQAGKPPGSPQKLTDYVKSLPEKPKPRQWSAAEIRNNPVAKSEHYGKLLDEQNRNASLRQISRDHKAGMSLNSKDVRNLSRDDHANIKLNGDKAVLTLIQEFDRTQKRGLER